jgi:hypothetical protein
MQGIILFVNTNIGGSRLVMRHPPILRNRGKKSGVCVLGVVHFFFLFFCFLVSEETMTHFKLRESVPATRVEQNNWTDPFSMPGVNLVKRKKAEEKKKGKKFSSHLCFLGGIYSRFGAQRPAHASECEHNGVSGLSDIAESQKKRERGRG